MRVVNPMPDSTIQRSVKSEIKNTLSLGIPLIISQLIYSCSGFIGTAMVARLGQEALAASVLVSMIWMSLSVFFFGILNAVSVLVSHQYGAKNDKAIRDVMGQALLFGMMICIPIILVLFSMPAFLKWSNQSHHVIHLASQYMRALLWTIPGLVVLVIYEQFLMGVGRGKIVLRISMLVVPIEIPLIYLLIFGKGWIPACGVAGVGYGFAITYTITAIFLVTYLLKSKQFRRFIVFNNLFEIKKDYLKELIRVGLPIGFMQMIEVSTFAITTVWIARFGTTILAAHQIVMQYLGFFITTVFAMSQAVTVRVGHAVGRQDLLGVQYAIYIGMVLSFLCILCIAAVFIWMPHLLLQLDINIKDPANNGLIRDTSTLLFICAMLLFCDNFRIIGFGALRGLKDTHFAMYTSLIGFWGVGLSMAFLLGFVFHLQGPGIWWGLVMGIATGAVIIMARLHYKLHHTKIITEPQP